MLPQRTLVLPPGITKLGADSSTRKSCVSKADSARTVFLLPPHYRGHEEEIARIYNLAGTRDVGLRAAWAWFKGLFGGQPVAAGED